MKFLLILIQLCFFICCVYGQIHRATNTNNYQIRYNANFTLNYYLKKFNSNFEQTSILNEFINNERLAVWITSIIGTFFVGICGILPVVVLPRLADNHEKLVKSNYFKCLLSFAAGTLLGDVFLHLMPETYTPKVLSDERKVLTNGLWILFGLLSFLTIEKIFPDDETENENGERVTPSLHFKIPIFNSIKIMGLLNLFANVIDNFTHGIAVAGSFQASIKFGFMTLIATLLHEIPHEIGDFVILLKSGLTYKNAALAQLTTAFSGIAGAIFALASTSAEQAGDLTSWILPFTSGGFLYISLVNIIPDILNETDLRSSIKQILSIIFGVYLIFYLNFMFE